MAAAILAPPLDDAGAVLAALEAWLAAGHRAALATVIETWGSAPRRVGAWLAIRDDGHFVGSVSGGCVEGAVLAEAPDVIAEGGFRLLDYGVADARAWDVGLACGGRIRVLLQAIGDRAFPPELVGALIAARRDGRAVSLATDLATGATAIGAEGAFVHRVEPPYRLMIVGAVHIAAHLAALAPAMGFAATVIDPRGAFAASQGFARVHVDARWPDEAMDALRPNAATAVVALTHDPKLDDPALAAALRSEAFYVAALGSRKNAAARRERLRAMGFGDAELDRVRGPAGLAIGAANPAEIALSVAAEMVAVRRGGLLAVRDR